MKMTDGDAAPVYRISLLLLVATIPAWIDNIFCVSLSLSFVLLLLLLIPSDGRIMVMGPLCDSVWIICIDCLCVCLSLFAHRLSSLFILYEPSRVHY